MACWGQCEGNIGLRLSELLQVYTECRVSYGGVALTTIWVNAKKLFFEDIWLKHQPFLYPNDQFQVGELWWISYSQIIFHFASGWRPMDNANPDSDGYSVGIVIITIYILWGKMFCNDPHPPYACQLAATLHFTSWYNFASWQKFLVSPAGKIIPAGLTFTSWQLSEII